MYRKPSIEEARKITNAFGSMKHSTMMKIRERTTKIVLMDYATYLINEKKLSHSSVMKSVNVAIDKAIEKGLCTEAMRNKLTAFVSKKFNTINPLLKLHYAATMEILDETNNELPEEVEKAAECGPECMGDTRPSIEQLIAGNTGSEQLFRTVGGTMCSNVIRSIQDVLNNDYVSER